MPEVGPERRRAPRFRVELHVEWHHETGLTRDVSDGGMFFVTQGSCSPGDPIEVAVVLEHVDPDRPVRLQCRGQVVRVEPGDGTRGVAVAISAYRLAMPALPH